MVAEPVRKGRALVQKRLALTKVQLGSGANALRSAAGPTVARSTAIAKRRTTQAVVYLRRFNKRSAAPSLSRFFKAAGRRLHPKSFGRDYRRLLKLWHATFFDRKVDARFFVPSRGRISLVRLSIPSQVRSTGRDYRPTPARVFEWAMSTLSEPLDRTVFVDYGAGRGRALLLASQLPFEKVVGAEIALELHDDCMMNIAQYPRSLMQCRDVECIRTRATTLPIPEQPCVFYFFDPFDIPVFEKVLARIVRSYKRSRREMHLICVGMDEADRVATAGVFHPVAFPWKHRLKIAMFSPYSVGIYKTDP